MNMKTLLISFLSFCRFKTNLTLPVKSEVRSLWNEKRRRWGKEKQERRWRGGREGKVDTIGRGKKKKERNNVGNRRG